jgi:hypothetical protein
VPPTGMDSNKENIRVPGNGVWEPGGGKARDGLSKPVRLGTWLSPHARHSPPCQPLHQRACPGSHAAHHPLLAWPSPPPACCPSAARVC